MINIKGKQYKTISDAAKFFDVSPKTVWQWIRNGVIPQPERKNQGLRQIAVFDDDYLENAKKIIENYLMSK